MSWLHRAYCDTRALMTQSKRIAKLENKLKSIRHLCTAELEDGGKPHTDHGVLHAYEVDYCVTCAVLKVLDE